MIVKQKDPSLNQLLRNWQFFLLLLAPGLLLSCASERDLLPGEILGHTLQRQLSGEEARQHVNQLHLQAVTDTENRIGFYQGEKEPATIYITQYADPPAAEADFVKMTEKISPQNSVFISGEYLEMNGRQVYRCFGMGQTHFVFTHREHLFWVSVSTVVGKQFVTAYLDYLN